MDSTTILDDKNINVEQNNDTNKNIVISGTNNRYQIKKLTKKEEMNKIKIRKESQRWNLLENMYNKEYQYELLKKINILIPDTLTNQNSEIIQSTVNDSNDLCKLMIQQVERKLNNYKQQDMLKKTYDRDNMIKLEDTITKLKESELLCYYCKKEMLILYEIVRENLQWTLDRIDNSLGHTKNNVIISCLSCNLKRRKQSKDAFLFTKQLQIVKKD